MLGALFSSAVLWVLIVVLAKDEMFSYRQAFLAVVISAVARFGVQIALAKAGLPDLFALVAGLVVGLALLFLYLYHLGYNRPLIARVLLYFVLIAIVMSGIYYVMDMPVGVN